MSVDRTEVDRIARLARLELEDDEADRLTDEMNRILEHAERLRTAGVDGAGATGAAGGAATDDAAGKASRSEDERAAGEAGGAAPAGMSGARAETGEPDALDRDPSAFAPEWEEGFFVVPPPPGVTAQDDG